MALGDPYASLVELKSYLKVTDSVDDTELTSALAAVSRGIEKYTRRQFNKTTMASARVFEPTSARRVTVDDFHTTTDLVIATDASGDGTFETTWSSSDYELRPLNGVVDGEQGWPYWRIRAVGSYLFPVCVDRASVQVTAQWGWDTVPAPVKQACLVLASEAFKLKDAPFGVAGYADWGPVRVRKNPVACQMLDPYVRNRVLVG